MCLFAAQAALLVISPILPEIAREFGVTTGTAAQLRSVSGITAGGAALILATVRIRWPLSTLLNVGLVLLGLGSLLSGWSPTFGVLLLAQVVIGVGLAAVLSGGLAASDAWAEDGAGARVLSRALIGQPVAWIVGQPLVGLVAGAGWRWAFLAVPLGSVLLALGAMLSRDRSISDGVPDSDPLGLWRQKGIRSWALSELFAYAAWAGTLVYAGALFIESYGLGVSATGAVLGLAAAFYLPGNSLGRRLLDKGILTLLTAFSVVAGILVIVMTVIRIDLVFTIVVFSTCVFFAAGRTIAGAAMGLQVSGGRRLAAMGIRTTLVQLGYLVGSGVGAVLLDRWGFAGIGWGFGALFVAAGIVHLPKTLAGERLVPSAGLLRRG
jgi:DHA1 family inner membrane transport protein